MRKGQLKEVHNMTNQKIIRRKHRKLKRAVINGITYIASINMFICLFFYGMNGYTQFLVGAVVSWLWCLLYAIANGSFKPVARKVSK